MRGFRRLIDTKTVITLYCSCVSSLSSQIRVDRWVGEGPVRLSMSQAEEAHLWASPRCCFVWPQLQTCRFAPGTGVTCIVATTPVIPIVLAKQVFLVEAVINSNHYHLFCFPLEIAEQQVTMIWVDYKICQTVCRPPLGHKGLYVTLKATAK